MNDFWKNVLRYPRFFISSFVGLIFILVTPIRNFFKIKQLRIFFSILVILFFGLLYFILVNMLAL